MKNITFLFLILVSNNFIFSMEAERKSLASIFNVEHIAQQHEDIRKEIVRQHVSQQQWWYVEKDLKHEHFVTSACFHKDGTKLLTAEASRSIEIRIPHICLYDVDTGVCIKKINSFAGDIYKLMFNHAGTKIIEHSRHKDWGGRFEVACYDMSLKCEYHFTDEPRQFCCFDKTDTEMLWYKSYCGEPKVVGISNVETKQIVSFHEFPSSICSAQFNNDETEIVITMSDGTLAVWNREFTRELLQCKHYTLSTYASFNKAGDELLMNYSSSPVIHVVDRQNGGVLKELNHLCRGIHFACFNHDGHEICTATFNGGVQIWDRKTGQKVAQLCNDDSTNRECAVCSLEWNRTGTKIVAGVSRNARIWARYDDCTLSQILLKTLLNLWLQLKKPSKEIDSPEKLLNNIAQLLLCDEKEMNKIWKSFPKHMQEVIWLSMYNKIQKYGK
ncbi:MAG TPA: hypothetical protein VHX42_03615 [Candidatus Babeliales bacterium]|jgi:WD40 repeat protein|nr:hypothetical protein [Candidatus Babeliales bacterium]